jgi:hypothetical protein
MFLKNSRDPYEAIDTSHGSLAQFFDFLEIIYQKVENFRKSIFPKVELVSLKNVQNEV